MWAALGFTRAPLYTGVTWKAQNQAAVLLAAGAKGHRYSFPHAKISTAPPILNRVFGQTVDAQLQANELVYATKYYAAILARATGKPLDVCQKEYLSRKRCGRSDYPPSLQPRSVCLLCTSRQSVTGVPKAPLIVMNGDQWVRAWLHNLYHVSPPFPDPTGTSA